MVARCIAVLAFCWGLAAAASAAVVSLAPSGTLANVGQQFTVNVVVSGLGAAEAVSGYDLDVVFDPAFITASQVVFAPSLGVDGVDQFGSAVLSAGRIDFAAISLLDEASLLALQVGSFTIAQLIFDAIGPGTGTITFDALTSPGLLLGDQFGNALAVTVGTQASATVVGGLVVPEPASASLALFALLALAASRRRA